MNDTASVRQVFFVCKEEEVEMPLIAELLERKDEVVVVHSGDRLFRKLEDQPWHKKPSLFILDSVLSGMSAYELLRRLRLRYDERKIPIFLLSNTSSPDEIAEAQLAGATELLLKSVTGADIDAATERFRVRYLRTEIGDAVLDSEAKK